MAPKATMTWELYRQMVEAFRTHPGQFAHVARLLNIAPSTASDGWRRGWKQLNLPPIRDGKGMPPPPATPPPPPPPVESIEDTAKRVVAEAAQAAEGAARRLVEDATARAVLEATAEEAARAAKEKARREAREAREQAQARADNRDNAAAVLETERKLRAGVRQVAGQNLIASTKWGAALIQVAEELVDRIEKLRKDMPLADLLEIAKVLAQVDRSRAFLVREAAELERLHRGDPSLIVGITPSQPMTLVDCMSELRTGERVLHRLEQKARGVIAGGPPKVDPPTIAVKPLQ